MKKPDVSKKGIKKFFLYHSEKLILVIALGLLGLFCWLGYQSKVFNEKTPNQLTDLANRADQYIVSPTSWDQMSQLDVRQAKDKIVELIELGNHKIDASKYPFGPWSVKAQTLEPRKDPALFEAKELIAHVLRGPVILSPANINSSVSDPLAALPLAESSPSMAESNSKLGREGSDDKKSNDKSKDEPQIEAGNAVLALHEQTLPGLRPTHYSLDTQSERSFLLNIVAITGLVDIKQQWKEYESSFGSSIGFYPLRDKPNYQFMEIQRTEVIDGKEKDWIDISDKVAVNQPKLYPRGLTKMPNAVFGSAPELVAADYFDPIITQPIPPLAQIDYRSAVIHPKVEARAFDPLPEGEKVPELKNANSIFGPVNNDTGDDPGRSGSSNAGSMDQITVRAGSDVSKYQRANAAKKARKDYKLVRFFDLDADAGVTYRYRVRLWLEDPNNESTGVEPGAASNSKPGAGRSGGFGKGGGLAGGDGASQGGGESGLGLGGGRQGSDPSDPKYKKIEITTQMKHPDVRDRLQSIRSVTDPADSSKVTYFVTEFRPSSDGTKQKEEIQVPAGHDNLRFARPTIWSDSVEVTVTPPTSPVIAGAIESPRTIRIGSGELADEEPITEIVPTAWSMKYNALLPARKKAYRGDALDFSADIHVMNSVTWQVHVYRNAPILTETVLVDMLGGKELDLPRNEPQRQHLPSEMLIMNPDGTFDVANDLEDRTKYKQALLLEDDVLQFGGEKAARQREKERDKNTGRGKRGGGGEGGF